MQRYGNWSAEAREAGRRMRMIDGGVGTDLNFEHDAAILNRKDDGS